MWLLLLFRHLKVDIQKTVKMRWFNQKEWLEICAPIMVIHQFWDFYLIWVTHDKVCSKKWTSKGHVLQWHWTMCSKYTYHSTQPRSHVVVSKNRESSLWPLTTFAFQLWLLNFHWQSLRLAVANQMRQFPIRSNGQKLCGVVSAHNHRHKHLNHINCTQ